MEFTLITPTYLPDLARAELLVESVQRCCPGLAHHLIVDHRDLPHFRHLSDRATIICSDDLLPWWIHRLPGRRSLWLSLRSRPNRGWIVQQILKITAASQVAADVSIFCDSDVAFVREFNPTRSLLRGDSVALLDVEFVNDEVREWTDVAGRLLGIAPDTLSPRGHVGNLICWRRDNVVSMIERIENVAGTDWRTALMRLPTFSEYILYGAHTRAVLGHEYAGQHPSTLPLVKASWGLDLGDEHALNDFFAELDPATVAVMIHSKDGIDPARYRDRLATMWDAVS
ncbi:MAG: DUF6492 family protein [Actinomycetia bacterium]|nr:DUF6492 family protein [Actinomycetes bacterium]